MLWIECYPTWIRLRFEIKCYLCLLYCLLQVNTSAGWARYTNLQDKTNNSLTHSVTHSLTHSHTLSHPRTHSPDHSLTIASFIGYLYDISLVILTQLRSVQTNYLSLPKRCSTHHNETTNRTELLDEERVSKIDSSLELFTLTLIV